MKLLLGFVVVVVLLTQLLMFVSAEKHQGFPPPPTPVMPAGFNIHCDFCRTMVKRMIPYCQRIDQNLDYLPDFCTFNYNQVLRDECDYIVAVAEFSYCPNACEELRRVQSFATGICDNSLINCTERVYVPPPSSTPSPSPSPSVAPDCVLCGHMLQSIALLCMNQEMVNQRTVYETCMTQTTTREYFQECVMFLGEIVDLAGSQDPCSLLECSEPQVTCAMLSNGCHVTRYNATLHGHSFTINATSSKSEYSRTQGLGPGDFRPGEKPYKSNLPLIPHYRREDLVAGSAFTPFNATEPTTPEGIEKKEHAEALAAQKANEQFADAPIPTPIPLKDISHQL